MIWRDGTIVSPAALLLPVYPEVSVVMVTHKVLSLSCFLFCLFPEILNVSLNIEFCSVFIAMSNLHAHIFYQFTCHKFNTTLFSFSALANLAEIFKMYLVTTPTTEVEY